MNKPKREEVLALADTVASCGATRLAEVLRRSVELEAENERLREMLSRTESALDVLAQTICDVEEIVGVELTVRAEAATELAMEVRAALRQEV